MHRWYYWRVIPTPRQDSYQPHLPDTQVVEDLAGCLVVAVVHGEAEAEVGVDGVEAFVLLQLVRAQFVAESDAAAFVSAQVDQDTGSGVGDRAEGGSELGSAVTAQGPGEVSGEALAVQAHQWCVGGGGIAHHQDHVLGAVAGAVVGECVEGADAAAPAGR